MTTGTRLHHCTFLSTYVLLCDQCEAYLNANCLSDANCTSLLSSFRAAIHANVSSLLYNGSLLSSMPISSVLLGPQTPFATMSLKAMTPFALYYSCISNYQCALNTTMVSGTQKNVVLSTTPEVHVISVPNTTATFNATIAYPSLNVSLVVMSSASSDLNYSLQSVWGVSLAPTVVLACGLSCNVTLTFPNLAIPLPLPRITSSFAMATATRIVQGNQTLMLLPPTTVTKTALVLSATCKACISQFRACAGNAACSNLLSCWRTNASIAATLNALQASPTLSSVSATANATICFANQTFASASLFASATSCLLKHACPVAADLSLAANITSILANRMIVPTATTAAHSIIVDTTNGVTLQLSLWGSSIGSVPNVVLATPAAMIAASVQTLLGGMGQVTATSASRSPTSWSLTLSYTNYIAPLPTITVVGASQYVSSEPASWFYKVVPFNGAAFGFPYTANLALLPDSMLSGACQACASLAAQCAMSTICASIASCVRNQTARDFTTALTSGAIWSSLEYTSTIASCTANVAYAAWRIFAQVMTCSESNACPLLSTTASVSVVAGRVLTPRSYAATQEMQVNAIVGVNVNVVFEIASTYIGEVLNVTSANSTESLTAQVQTLFAGIAKVTVMTWSNSTAWYLGVWYERYYGPPPVLRIYGSHSATMTVNEGSRKFVNVAPWSVAPY